MSRALAHTLVVAILAALLAVAFWRSGYEFHWAGVWEYRQKFVSGWLTTVAMSLCSLVLSALVGLVTAIGLRSRWTVVEAMARVYVELIRGTPLLVQLLIGFYVVANSVGLENRYVVGALVLALFSGAYMAEIFRGGLAAIPAGQRDAARAIGLTPWQSLRLVILPQAVRLVLPAVAGQLVSLIKDSSLLYIIGIPELTFAANQINSATYSTFESFVPLGICYLVLTLPVSLWTKYLESKVRYET
jgi:polar amino acid transport system permease protein